MKNKMTKKQLFNTVIAYFEQQMPVAETELHYKTPFELLVAVMLSAQCTDKRVNQITPGLFARFPDPYTMSVAQSGEIYDLIKSCSYPNSKANHLSSMAKMLVQDYAGVVPDNMEELQTLPGVGRKTANVMLIVAFNKPAMPVDTHVFRVSARIGLTENAKTPLDTEKQLVQYFPQELLSKAHHWLILHGRYVCQARKPKCESCGLTGVCNWYKKNEG